MPPTPRGRTCDRPNSGSSTTADRASDDCAAYRAASRRTLRVRIRQRNYRRQRQEKQQRWNPMHQGTPQNLARQIPHRTKRRFDKMRRRRSSLLAKRPTILVRAVIECNDDVASVNAALCQVAHD
jgi:hypothetical protein